MVLISAMTITSISVMDNWGSDDLLDGMDSWGSVVNGGLESEKINLKLDVKLVKFQVFHLAAILTRGRDQQRS